MLSDKYPEQTRPTVPLKLGRRGHGSAAERTNRRQPITAFVHLTSLVVYYINICSQRSKLFPNLKEELESLPNVLVFD